jgi:hypothetical protein
MTVKDRQSPQIDSGAGKAAQKQARLSAALRANLARRKAQARARDGAAPDSSGKPPRPA